MDPVIFRILLQGPPILEVLRLSGHCFHSFWERVGPIVFEGRTLPYFSRYALQGRWAVSVSHRILSHNLPQKDCFPPFSMINKFLVPESYSSWYPKFLLGRVPTRMFRLSIPNASSGVLTFKRNSFISCVSKCARIAAIAELSVGIHQCNKVCQSAGCFKISRTTN